MSQIAGRWRRCGFPLAFKTLWAAGKDATGEGSGEFLTLFFHSPSSTEEMTRRARA